MPGLGETGDTRCGDVLDFPVGDRPICLVDDKPEGRPEGDNPEGNNPEDGSPEGDNPEDKNPEGKNPEGDFPVGENPEGPVGDNRVAEYMSKLGFKIPLLSEECCRSMSSSSRKQKQWLM